MNIINSMSHQQAVCHLTYSNLVQQSRNTTASVTPSLHHSSSLFCHSSITTWPLTQPGTEASLDFHWRGFKEPEFKPEGWLWFKYCEDKSLPDKDEMDRIDMLSLHIVSPSGYRIVIFYIGCTGHRIVMVQHLWLSGLVGPVRSCQTWYCQFTWLAIDWSINDVDSWQVFDWLIESPVWPGVNDNPVQKDL